MVVPISSVCVLVGTTGGEAGAGTQGKRRDDEGEGGSFHAFV